MPSGQRRYDRAMLSTHEGAGPRGAMLAALPAGSIDPCLRASCVCILIIISYKKAVSKQNFKGSWKSFPVVNSSLHNFGSIRCSVIYLIMLYNPADSINRYGE